MAEKEEQTLTPEQEAAVLAVIPPRRLLEILRAVAGLPERVFAGFRATAESLKNPLVRQRLRRESESYPEFRQRLRETWEGEHGDLVAAIAGSDPDALPETLPDLTRTWGPEKVRVALLLDARETVQGLEPPAVAPPSPPPPAPTKPTAPPEDPQVPQLRAQLREVRAELAATRRELERTQAQREEARRLAEQQKALVEEAQRDAETLRRLVDRHTRQEERLRKESADAQARAQEAIRAQRRLSTELDAQREAEEERTRAEAARAAEEPPASAWLQTARQLAAGGHAQSAVNFLAHLARAHPHSFTVREALAEAYQATGAVPAAVTELCWLARRQRQRGELADAFARACRALVLAPTDTEAGRCVKEIAGAIPATDQECWKQVSRSLAALAKECPAAHRVAAPLVPGKKARGEKAAGLDMVLASPPGAGGFSAPVRAVLEAVDANRADVVARARRALSQLRAHSPEKHAAILDVLARHDDSYRIVLSRRTEPVVVDGSNIAWHGGVDRPRLAHLHAIRRELRSLGYFPILVYVDAALIHQIDQPTELNRLVARGEVVVADAGTDGDETILREARELGCAVVTNDRMRDHDVDEVVEKLRFDIGPDGAILHGRQWG